MRQRSAARKHPHTVGIGLDPIARARSDMIGCRLRDFGGEFRAARMLKQNSRARADRVDIAYREAFLIRFQPQGPPLHQ